MIKRENITFFVTAYERYDYFETAVNSLLNQTVKPSKIIVIDDSSSHSKFRDFVEAANNPALSYVRNEKNLGLTGTWNRCIDLCETEWMTILHDDDCLHHTYLEKLIDYSKEVPENVNVYSCRCSLGSEVFFGETLVKGIRKFTERDYLYDSPSQFPGILFRTTVGKQLGYFNHDYYPCSDLKFWLDLTKAGGMYLVREKLAFYRVSNNQVTASTFLTILNQACRIKHEILKDRDSFLNRFVTRRSIIAQFEAYLKSYRLDRVATFQKLKESDCSFKIIRDHCGNQENIFGRIRSRLSLLAYKILIASFSLRTMIVNL